MPKGYVYLPYSLLNDSKRSNSGTSKVSSKGPAMAQIAATESRRHERYMVDVVKILSL